MLLTQDCMLGLPTADSGLHVTDHRGYNARIHESSITTLEELSGS